MIYIFSDVTSYKQKHEGSPASDDANSDIASDCGASSDAEAGGEGEDGSKDIRVDTGRSIEDLFRYYIMWLHVIVVYSYDYYVSTHVRFL